MARTKPKVGRPALPPGEARTLTINVPVNRAERERVLERARREKAPSLAEYGRKKLLG